MLLLHVPVGNIRVPMDGFEDQEFLIVFFKGSISRFVR